MGLSNKNYRSYSLTRLKILLSEAASTHNFYSVNQDKTNGFEYLQEFKDLFFEKNRA